MLSLPAAVRIHLAVEPCDMRRGFDALSAMVSERLGDDPLSGHLFVFRSRRGDRVKVLSWDRDGFSLWYKRLEKGVFRFVIPESARGSVRLELSRREFMMALEGLDEIKLRKSRRFTCAR